MTGSQVIIPRQDKDEKKEPRLFFSRKCGLILLYGILYAAAAFLLLYNLSDRLLWGDEAETALLGRNILEFGIPLVDDGKNVLTQYPEPWEANDAGVWTWNTWLSYYVAALSLGVFGQTTFAARFPFAAIGLLAVILMRKAARDLYDDEETAFVATLLLAFSVPFLLHARQCRYFSMLALGTIWLIIGYNRLVFMREKKYGLHVAVALAFLFYSSFISFVGGAAGVGLHSLVQMKNRRETLREVFPFFALAGALIAPWVLYSGLLGKRGSVEFGGVADTLLYYIQRMNFHIFPVILLLLPPISLIARRVPVKRWLPGDKTGLLLFVIGGHFAVLSVFPFVYFRYLITVMPALFLLEARMLRRYVPARAARYFLVFLLAATNIPGIISLYPIRGDRRISLPLAEFVAGITSDYEDAFEDVVGFLQDNAYESESLALTDPGYPFIFYTGMKVIDARYPRSYEKVWEANWVLSDNAVGVIDYGPASFLTLPASHADMYRANLLEVRDTPLGASRPDPDLHRHLTADAMKPLIVYRRMEESAR
ncbi:MAG: hypothetical protein C4520_01685 [Candidatus Abyssobacteria bacterium SURF_5]|uniref:Glycosyltransferase RgtA/B/C/D-like domain-containing protein n=1 Tax=Abyssobacteria bacterium (strain SURF_5) TaxID=2093360 RepID=A0A3A4P909_ABYX5|nr:MAG: hypothetical protein C4520_01685 [Candidatus Abyssubacteria bacterium SURF_5]